MPLRRTSDQRRSPHSCRGNGTNSNRRLRFEPLEDRRLLSITVNTLVDENNGVGVGAGTSLREAIAAAVPGDTIDFSVTGTINLSIGATNSTKNLTINKSLTIHGPGASLLTIKAFDPTPTTKTGDGSRAILIDDGNAANLLDVEIDGLTVTGADSSAAGGAICAKENLILVDSVLSGNTTVYPGFTGGAGVYSNSGSALPSSLTIVRSTISGNTSANSEGGGIRKRYGTLVIEDSTISGNKSFEAGGGLSVADGNVVVSIKRSTFSQNQITTNNSFCSGGGIFALNVLMTVSDSTITGNIASGGSSGFGGGIYIAARNGGSSSLSISHSSLTNNYAPSVGGGLDSLASSVTITGCTISGNHTSSFGSGGGIYGFGLTVEDSTINGNSARTGGGITSRGTAALIAESTISGNTSTSFGSAVYIPDGTVTIRSSTITANTSPAGTPGAVVSNGKNEVITNLQSSIVAGNTNGDLAWTLSNNTFVSLGFNLIGTIVGDPSFTLPTDQLNISNPMLGPLANNGGPTKTHAPLAGSPAIDAGDLAALEGINGVPLFDGRGAPFGRVFDGDGAGGARIDIGAFEVQPQTPPPIFYGDFNLDGIVNAADYVVWRMAEGQSVSPYSGADGTGNGLVGPEDYALWRANFGSVVPSTPASGSGEVVRFNESIASGEQLVASSPATVSLPSVADPLSLGASLVSKKPKLLRQADCIQSASNDYALAAWLASPSRKTEFLSGENELASSRQPDTDSECYADAVFAALGTKSLA